MIELFRCVSQARKSSLSNRALSAAPRRSDPFGNALDYHALGPEIAVRRHRVAGVGAFGDLAAQHHHQLLPRRACQGRKDTRRIAWRGFRASVVFVADDQDGDRDRARFGIEDCLAGAPAAASAGRRLRPEVSKNSSTAMSSNEGELVGHHLRAGHGLFKALAGDAVDAALGRGGDDLVAAWRKMATAFEPIRPVPPMTTIFMIYPLLWMTAAPKADLPIHSGNPARRKPSTNRSISSARRKKA